MKYRRVRDRQRGGVRGQLYFAVQCHTARTYSSYLSCAVRRCATPYDTYHHDLSIDTKIHALEPACFQRSQLEWISW
uniref:Uncharacterized protein n=1 Tax=Romanomermis culicivorax TaxID=13658 RepID=A0A915L9W8_ROMCU